MCSVKGAFVVDVMLGRSVEEDGEMVVQLAMEMSLDEWKAMQEMSRPKAEFNIRKAENKIPSKAKVIHQSRHPEVSGLCKKNKTALFM